MSFWRYKILELIVALAFFPIAAVTYFALMGLVLQFVDFDANPWAFHTAAIPFLIAWLLTINRITKRLETRWLAKHGTAGNSVDLLDTPLGR